MGKAWVPVTPLHSTIPHSTSSVEKKSRGSGFYGQSAARMSNWNILQWTRLSQEADVALVQLLLVQWRNRGWIVLRKIGGTL